MKKNQERRLHRKNAKIVKEGGTPLQLNRPIKPDTTVTGFPLFPPRDRRHSLTPRPLSAPLRPLWTDGTYECVDCSLRSRLPSLRDVLSQKRTANARAGRSSTRALLPFRLLPLRALLQRPQPGLEGSDSGVGLTLYSPREHHRLSGLAPRTHSPGRMDPRLWLQVRR